MRTYQEYVIGAKRYRSVIYQAPLFEERSTMREDCYYPMLSGDPLEDEDMEGLERAQVLACREPGDEPANFTLFIDDLNPDFAYMMIDTEE